jgi:hypothetical protein
MDDGKKQEKSTGYSLSTRTVSESGLAPVESTAKKKVSPVLENARLKGESLTSTAVASLSKLLVIQIMIGDFKALKAELPASRQSSSNGKIYWCAEMPGHILAMENGRLIVDGHPVDLFVSNLLDDEKVTGS